MTAQVAPSLGHPDVLVVDDDSLVVHQLQAMLRGMARLRMASSGSQALRLCDEVPPDLILLDLNMQGLDGIQALRQLRGRPDTALLPVIFITAEQDAARHAQALDLGADDWLTKPLIEERVRSRVQSVLRRVRRAQQSVPPPLGSRPVVLVVDDDHIAIAALHAALAPLGVECVAASSGADALALARRQPPDVVLLDVQMPGMDGFEVAAALLALPALAPVPVVFLTRHANVATETRALDMGAHDFISKPFSEPVLQARVRNVLMLRRRTQEALREAREHWRQVSDTRVADIVAGATDAIVSLDAQGTVVLANPAASSLFGVSMGHLVGQALPDWVRKTLTAAGGEQDRPSARVTLSAPGHQPITLRCACSVSGSGSDALSTYIMHDLTLQERAEAEARERVRAQAESRTKTLMMSYLAHEIGNPLNAVLGLAQLLALDEPGTLSSLQQERLQMLLESGRLLDRLLRDAIDLARWDSGRFDLRLCNTELRSTMKSVLAGVATQAADSSVTLQVGMPDDPVTVQADPARLQQCLFNLLSNAVKYGGAGGTVTVQVQVLPGQVAIAVSDQGPGMTEEQLDHLFEPFNRLGQSNQPGQGLGLAVSRLLVQAMGGRLSASSTPGRGCTFTMELPGAAPVLQTEAGGGI